ncbi:hypothetical protein ACOMHN_051025 [Nucella lapillus]
MIVAVVMVVLEIVTIVLVLEVYVPHFPCNVRWNCVSGEDEERCPYTNEELCGPGQLWMTDSCHQLFPERDVRLWTQSSLACSQRGGQLSRLNTPEKWAMLTRCLALQHRQLAFFGISTFPFPTSPIHNNTRRGTNPNHQTFRHTVTPSSLLPSEGRYANQSHVTHEFLACDSKSHCLSGEECGLRSDPPPPSFGCDSERQEVAYTLVCDHREDCSDRSDERFCVFAPCPRHSAFDCGDGHCIGLHQRCDFMKQCVLGTDEDGCNEETHEMYRSYKAALPAPALVDMDSRGLLVVKPLSTVNSSMLCPSTHIECQTPSYYCLPVYLRYNRENDCPGHEDEADCQDYTCPGYYRCRGSPVCVHADHVCDHRYGQCPHNDDELLCDLTCPLGCRCVGLAFYCSQSEDVSVHPDLRYLNADGTNMTLMDLANNAMLIHVSLAACSLVHFQAHHLPNLRLLDPRDNLISHLVGNSFDNTRNLRALVLAGNPLNDDYSFAVLSECSSLRVLDLSRVRIDTISVDPWQRLVHLRQLNLSHSGVSSVQASAFHSLRSLRSLDLLGCPVTTFPPGVFHNLVKLRSVTASNYKLCCSVVLPEGFNPVWCQAPAEALSSCEDLMQSNFHRIVLTALTVLALVGNLTSFLYRTVFDKRTRQSGFGVFVIHLCVSDFLMGVYLMMIGLADHAYKDVYLWNDNTWRHSTTCRAAGFLSLWSSEVSAFLICIITVDRFLVLQFPFSQLHFAPKSAHLASSIIWSAGAVMAAVPLMPVTSHWQFYSQTGICIPLPITKPDFPGHYYSFGILIGLNFALFLFIAAGQAFIYWSITSNTIAASGSTGKSKDQVIARRLISVGVSDFACWFHIGVMGVMAVTGADIAAEVNVVMAIIVLPLNSALNPFLYTLNVIVEHRRKGRDKRLLVVLAQLQDEGK